MVQHQVLKHAFLTHFLTHFWSQNGPFPRHFSIFHGPKPVITGSKRAGSTCLSFPNGPKSFLEKHVFDPFSTHFWSQNGPFSRHFGIFRGPKRVTTGSSWAENTCLSIPNGLGSLLEKCVLDPFFDPFFDPKWPVFKAVWVFHGPKHGTTSSKMGYKHLLEHREWSMIFIWRNAFLTHFLLILGPKTAHFQGIL